MKANTKVKEWFNGYSNWCDEGREHGYGNFLMMILLLIFSPLIVALFFHFKTNKLDTTKEEEHDMTYREV